MSLVIDALIPAWNEAESIGETIESLVAQTKRLRKIVIIPNGCSDDTAKIAREYASEHDNIIVLELPALENRKSEALNLAWDRYSKDADVVITADADTTFEPDAVALWEEEFLRFRNPHSGSGQLGGSTAKAIVLREGYWGRMQKQEYAKVIDATLIRGSTSVLAGAGTAFNGSGLRQIASLNDGREGPWSYLSMTEDYEITIQLRILGYEVITSPNIRMYTDGMPTLKALWSQRIKWGVGQLHELITHGVTRYTIQDWGAVAWTAVTIAVHALWLTLMAWFIATGTLKLHWFWWTVYPAFFVAFNLYMSGRIAFVDRKDRWYAITIFPYLVYGIVGMSWIVWTWIQVARERLTGHYVDRWEAQSRAEA